MLQRRARCRRERDIPGAGAWGELGAILAVEPWRHLAGTLRTHKDRRGAGLKGNEPAALVRRDGLKVHNQRAQIGGEKGRPGAGARQRKSGPIRRPFGLESLGERNRILSLPTRRDRYGEPVSDGVASRTPLTTTVTRVSITGDVAFAGNADPNTSRPPEPAAVSPWWLVTASAVVLGHFAIGYAGWSGGSVDVRERAHDRGTASSVTSRACGWTSVTRTSRSTAGRPRWRSIASTSSLSDALSDV